MAKTKKDFTTALGASPATPEGENINLTKVGQAVSGIPSPSAGKSATDDTDVFSALSTRDARITSSGSPVHSVKNTVDGTRACPAPEDVLTYVDAALRTQGKKGEKLVRMTVALPDLCYDYVRTMASLQGATAAVILSHLVANDIVKHYDDYQQAKQFVAKFQNGAQAGT